jgi:hypothetical protein
MRQRLECIEEQWNELEVADAVRSCSGMKTQPLLLPALAENGDIVFEAARTDDP